MIVTVTLNPVLRVHYDADQVELGAANRVSLVRHEASGRGLAVARLLQTFGHDVVAAGLAGGSSGELIRIELAKAGVATQFTRISAESRRVVRIADGSAGQVTSLEEPSPYITTEELGRLAADFRALLDGATAVVLCGSLPAGLPPETYGSLTSYAARAGVPVVLDAAGSALRHGAARRPALVIPGRLETAGDVAAELIATELVAAGAGSAVVQTERGLRAVTCEGEWQAAIWPQALRDQDEQTAAGRRDALVAGFVPGIALGWSWPDMLRHAAALAASVSRSGDADLASYESLLPQVAISGPKSVSGLDG